MSGIKTTSIFGSIINNAIFRALCRFGGITFDYLMSLGDDIDCNVWRLQDIDVLFDLYKWINFKVSATKTSLSGKLFKW